VVWATGARVVRLGELRRGRDASASFEFSRPAGFDAYSLVVTAEQSARAPRPAGAFVFSTRAGEIGALYPPKPQPRAVPTPTTAASTNAAREGANSPAANPPASPAAATHPTMTLVAPAPTVRSGARSAYVADFYESVNAAVSDAAAARTIALAGVDGARRAAGEASVATRGGTAYVRVRFRRVPPPTRFGVRKYVMWAQSPGEGTYFLRALPRSSLNRRPTYARRPNFTAPDFNLLVTAERRYPRPRPRGRRVLVTRRAH
ncbi:MAG: hypothetical protein ABR563_07835, partial [Pyrinomonadaceae bacterium]